MNPRQRRGVLFMLLAVLGGLVVLVATASYVNGVDSQVGPRVTVLQAAAPLTAYQPLEAAQLEEVEVPARYAPGQALTSVREAEGQRVALNLSEGTTLTTDLLVPPSDLSPTERELAVNVDAVTGIAGRALPGDRVDIYAVYGESSGLPPQVRVLVRGVRVVTVGGQQTVAPRGEEEREPAQVLPVTLALEPDDALAVTFASNFAEEVRLVGLPAGQSEDRSEEASTYDVGRLAPQESAG